MRVQGKTQMPNIQLSKKQKQDVHPSVATVQEKKSKLILSILLFPLSLIIAYMYGIVKTLQVIFQYPFALFRYHYGMWKVTASVCT